MVAGTAQGAFQNQGVTAANMNGGAQPAAGGAGSNFCPNCGTASNGAKFCPNCGKQL
jgi:membrane protease subunit (stomatin/prohibitin family)